MPNRYDLGYGMAPMRLGLGNAPATKAGLALGSVYTYASAGAAIGFRFVAPVSAQLSSVYFFVTAILGTPAVHTVELRNWNTTTISKPGTTLHASQTVSPGVTANKWIKCTFGTPYSVVRGMVYWIVIGNASWTSGNTATVLHTAAPTPESFLTSSSGSFTTADGFASAGTAINNRGSLVFVFSDGSLFGFPYTLTATYTSNDRERGMKILGLTEDVTVYGINCQLNSTTALMTGFKVYAGEATAPGGTAEQTVAFPTGGAKAGLTFFAPFVLRKNRVYRVVFTYSGSEAGSYNVIEDVATGGADFTNLSPGGGTMYGTIDNGAGGWTDATDQFPIMALLIQDMFASRHPSSPMRGPFG